MLPIRLSQNGFARNSSSWTTYALINLRKLFVSPFCIKITDMVKGQDMNTNSTDYIWF